MGIGIFWRPFCAIIPCFRQVIRYLFNHLIKALSKSTSHSYKILKQTDNFPSKFFIFLSDHVIPVFLFFSPASTWKNITLPKAFWLEFKFTHRILKITLTENISRLEHFTYMHMGHHYVFCRILKDKSNNTQLEGIGVNCFMCALFSFVSLDYQCVSAHKISVVIYNTRIFIHQDKY